MINKFILDVDGVLTTGHSIYSNQGKVYKIFGPHDKDGLKLIRTYINDIHFITADQTGFEITKARIVKDWKFPENALHLVSEEERSLWFVENTDFNRTAYMGDGIFDAPILRTVKIGIAPSNAREEARRAATYVTPSKSGYGAVLDACLYLEKVMNGLVQV
jgi:3-deoxy-D-manno-octulosonate 8-phosphate phosphatase (KDO 8-P phosphatase)